MIWMEGIILDGVVDDFLALPPSEQTFDRKTEIITRLQAMGTLFAHAVMVGRNMPPPQNFSLAMGDKRAEVESEADKMQEFIKESIDPKIVQICKIIPAEMSRPGQGPVKGPAKTQKCKCTIL